jgi:hypothetical protein
MEGQCVDEVLAMFAPGKREAVKRYQQFVAEVGKQLNLLRAGVSVAADRGERIVKDNPTLLKLVDDRMSPESPCAYSTLGSE